MRKLTFGLMASLIVIVFACGAEPTTAAEAPVTTEEQAPEEEKTSFGADFTADNVIAAAELLANFDEAAIEDTVQTTLRGTVGDVCQKKGCWMTVAAGDDQEMMVRFKDYGFFMPFDLGGKEVVMNGIAYYEVTPVDELRHYAEDAGDSPEEIAMITEPKRELKFLADGVKMVQQ